MQIGGDADNGIDQGCGRGNAKRRATSCLQVEMLRIDAHRGKPGEYSAGAATDRRGQDTFEPKFKSIHKLNQRNKGLFVECGDGVVHDVKGPLLVAAVRARFPVVQNGALICARETPRPLDGAGNVLRDRRR